MNEARECSRFAARLTLLPPSRAASATLLACPPLNPGNYVLVRREPEGARPFSPWGGSSPTRHRSISP